MNILNVRKKILIDNPYLTLKEKLRLASRFGVSANEKMKDIVQGREILEDGERFIDIAGNKFYIPEDAPDSFIRGMAQVIGEMYIFCEEEPEQIKLKAEGVYLDLGANIGTTVINASNIIGDEGKIIAIEPVTTDVLNKNLQKNNINNVTVIPKAVSDKAGFIDIDVSASGIDSRLDKVGRKGKTVKVELTTIDNIVNDQNLSKVNLIKMDIEGAEESAILGAVNTIEKFKPNWTIASYHIDFVGEPQHPKLIKLLKTFGYEIIEIPGQHIYAFFS